MLQVFAFGRIGVVLGDLYFLDPNPGRVRKVPSAASGWRSGC